MTRPFSLVKFLDLVFSLNSMKILNKKLASLLEVRGCVLVVVLVPLHCFASSCFPDERILPEYKNQKNYLAFENFGYRGIGRCRGHAIVAQKMDILAKYRVKNPHPCLGQDDQTCYTTLSTLVKKVMSGKVVEIGGFDSLYEFSKDPIARQVLRNRIINIPHRYQAEDSPLEIRDHEVAKVNIFNDIVRRISLKVRPYIAIKGTIRISSHALIGYKVIESNGSKLICVRDPNVVIRDIPFEDCQNFLYLADNLVYYHQFGFPKDEKLFLISLKTDDDMRTEEYIKAHLEICSKKNRF